MQKRSNIFKKASRQKTRMAPTEGRGSKKALLTLNECKRQSTLRCKRDATICKKTSLQKIIKASIKEWVSKKHSLRKRLSTIKQEREATLRAHQYKRNPEELLLKGGALKSTDERKRHSTLKQKRDATVKNALTI
jgi:hypothetical protein